ncbi:hypothetical protein I302_107482 [Kwoniella bestiolae CBS 10118]|uniref:Uncharacterized protein n=1 Tax=Kwoniella bestiolae CBS 10118 TaxID=1296100 RepID=A0A1B9FYE7_9TREE|nr:hypothetical protein I302_06777 [Kwoniella bestiolae CBS 10118]OCF23793.1 hypothetical protein I302_06777 [Kwoniella bestiolae CBS 10118]
MSASQSQEYKMTVIRRPMAFNPSSADTYSAEHVKDLLADNDIPTYLVGRFEKCGSVVVVGNVPRDESVVEKLSTQISCPHPKIKKLASITADLWINDSFKEEKFGFTAYSLVYEGKR